MGLAGRLGLRVASQWVAGDSIPDAINQARKSNSVGFRGIINFFGEDIDAPRIAEEHVAEYRRLIKAIVDHKVDACISLKLTQIGLSIDRMSCSTNLTKILTTASEENLFVWLDMEGSAYTSAIIEAYLSHFSAHSRMGVAIQANLKRTYEDLRRILDSGGMVRLVKGAYNETPGVAHKSKREIDRNFSQLMGVLFKEADQFALGTHDDQLCNEAKELNRKYGRKLEFQFLMGIRRDLKQNLVKEGYRVLDYIPYGQNWFPYMSRRLREKPSNILLMLRSMISG